MLSCVQLSAAPWIIVCQAPLSMGFPGQEYWRGEPFPFPGYVLNPEMKPRPPALQAGSLPPEPPAQLCKACVTSYLSLCKCWTVNNYWLFKVLLTVSALGCSFPFQFSSVQSLSCVRLFETPWTAARQASLSITNSRSPPKPMSTESVMPSNHLILCRPLLLLPSIFPSIRVFSSESALLIRWPKYWSFSFSISLPMNTQDWSPLGWTGWLSLQSKGLSRVFSNTTVQKHQFFAAQLSL